MSCSESEPPADSGDVRKEEAYRDAEDLQLVRWAQEGDMTAFEQIYRRHSGRVYALCLRFSGEPGKAEDLTQDVFVRIWMKVNTFRGDSAFTTWLHRLSVNVVLGEWRTRARRAKRESASKDQNSEERPVPEGKPALRMDLESAVASLPHKARIVFVLHDVEGYKHEEISKLVGIAEGTSKAQLHWARKLLREALG
ncbi:RNA polymerase sigma factor [Acidobacteriota bacterium]